MSTLITLAKERKYQGTFTQRKILWGFLEQLEGKKPTDTMDQIDSLVILTPSGKIESPTGSGLRFTTMTYAHLCTAMRDNPKVALHDAGSFEPLYGLWQSEPNTLFSEEMEETKELQ